MLRDHALQAIPEEREGRIEVRGNVRDGRVVICVHDNGSGIAEEDQDRIFRPNFTTKNSGMGLGLAMVQRLVENAGGTVSFESTPDVGTTFFVSLPLRT